MQKYNKSLHQTIDSLARLATPSLTKLSIAGELKRWASSMSRKSERL